MAKQKQETPPPVQLTKRACVQVKKALVREHAPEGAGMRVLLINTGSGYRYDLQIETKAQDDDHLSLQGGIKIYIDQFAANYLNGTQLDFREVPAGEGFLFIRPQDPGGKDS